MTRVDRESDLRAILEVALATPVNVSARDFVEKMLAGMFGRQPDMSGDQRNRLLRHELAEVGRAADWILRALAIAIEFEAADLEED